MWIPSLSAGLPAQSTVSTLKRLIRKSSLRKEKARSRTIPSHPRRHHSIPAGIKRSTLNSDPANRPNYYSVSPVNFDLRGNVPYRDTALTTCELLIVSAKYVFCADIVSPILPVVSAAQESPEIVASPEGDTPTGPLV